MKFIVSSASLLKQLQLTGGVLSSNNALPILDNFLFDINGNDLSISASDLEITMSAKMQIESKENGKVAIPGKLLIDILKTFPDHPLTFTVSKENFGIEILSDYGKYKLSGFNGEEFPKTPAIEQATTVDINSKVLLGAINKTLFAAGNDELRPVMSGVFCELSQENITFVATDAHKLVRYKRFDSKAGKTSSFILPSKPLTLLRSNLGTKDVDVKIEYNASNAFFSFDNINLICRLIEGKQTYY